MPMFSSEPEPQKPRIRGRDYRGITVNTKLTGPENETVLDAAKTAGKTVGEWLREVALKAAANTEPDPTFTEVVYSRNAILSLLQMVAQKTGVAQDAIAKSANSLRQDKHQKAVKTMEEYTQPTTKER